MLERPKIVAFYDETQLLHPKQRASDIRVVLVSDTHNMDIDPSRFPDGDLLLHAGDHTIDGTKEELLRASNWLKDLAGQYPLGCVSVAGNHDQPLDTESYRRALGDSGKFHGQTWNDEDLEEARHVFSGGKVTLLQHEAVTVAGLKIFGSPYVRLSPSREKLYINNPRRTLGFNRDEETLRELYARIPGDCDILMTHAPRRGTLDLSTHYSGKRRDAPVSIGSVALANWWDQQTSSCRPALHVFGHEHESRGIKRDDDGNSVSCNAASVDGDRGIGGYTLKPEFRAFVVDFRFGESHDEL